MQAPHTLAPPPFRVPRPMVVTRAALGLIIPLAKVAAAVGFGAFIEHWRPSGTRFYNDYSHDLARKLHDLNATRCFDCDVRS